MSVNLGSATAYIDLDSSKFESGLKKTIAGLKTAMDSSNSTSERFTALGTTMSSVGKSMTMGISVPLAGIATVATKTAIETEQSFAKVNSILQLNKTSVGGAKSEWDEFSVSLKKGANDIGLSYSTYADAAYDAISAGVEQANVTKFLTDANKLAKGGLTDLTTATNLLTTVQNSYNLSQEDMARVSDVLIQTQNKGKTTVNELGASMGKIIPTAKGLNVGIEQLGAGYALMTSKGIATAETTTYMNAMFNELGKSGTKVDEVLKNVAGKSFNELMESGMSVAEALDLVNQHAEKNNLSLSDMFGSSEAAKAAQVLLGDSIDETTGELIKGERSAQAYNDMLSEMENSTGSTNKAFEEMNNTAKEKLAQSLEKLKNAASDLGIAFIPLVEQVAAIVGQFAEWVTGIAETNPELLDMAAKVGLVAAAIGPLLMIGGSLIQAITTIGGAFSGLGGILTGTSTLFGATATAAGGVAGPMAGAAAGGTALAGVLGPVLIAALVAMIAKIGDSETALGFMQDKFGSVGTVIGAVCEFISGVWDRTIGNLVEVGKLGFDLLAAVIDGPGGASVKDAFSNFNDRLTEKNDKAWDKITLKTTRELSQQKNSIDKETKEAADKADKNTKKMADSIEKNTKKASTDTDKNTKEAKVKADANTKAMADVMGTNAKIGAEEVGKSMSQTSKVVFDETGKIPKDVSSNMNASVLAMRQAGSDIYNGMNTSFSKLASQGKKHFSDLYNGVTRSTSKMATEVIADWNSIKSALSSKITGTVEIKTVGVQAALNQINSVKNASKSSLVSDIASIYNNDTSMLMDEASRMIASDRLASNTLNAYSNANKVQSSNVDNREKQENKDSKSKSITINNTYNSPKPASIKELKKQDAIQMRRLAMQF